MSPERNQERRWVIIYSPGADEDAILAVMALEDGWEARVRIVIQDGQPVPAELRVVRGRKTPDVPSGGLTTRAVREIPLWGAVDEAHRRLSPLVAADMPSWIAGSGLRRQGFTSDPLRKPGRKGRPDRYYATIARAYLEAVRRGSRQPVKDVATELSAETGGTISPAYVRDQLHVARSRSRALLTRPPKGKAGGELTEKALRALEEEDQ